MNTIEVLKLIAIPLTFAMSIVPGVLPIYCKGCKQNPKCMSIVMTFSGGIFLAMGLTVGRFDEEHSKAASHFPLPNTVFILGYFLIFAFEKLICPNTHEIAHHHEHDDGEHGNGHSRVGDSMVKIKDAEEGNGVHEEHPSSQKVTISHKESSSHGVNTAKFCQSLVIMVALGIHSFFEGLALGVNGIEEDVIALFFGIGLHKWAEGLSIATHLIKRDSKNTLRAFWLLFIFSLITPLGVGIGWAILEFSTGLVSIILGAFSAGTFLYVGALEVPETEFSQKKDSLKCLKYWMYFIGFAVIVIADTITKNTYGHSH